MATEILARLEWALPLRALAVVPLSLLWSAALAAAVEAVWPSKRIGPEILAMLGCAGLLLAEAFALWPR